MAYVGRALILKSRITDACDFMWSLMSRVSSFESSLSLPVVQTAAYIFVWLS